MSNDLNKLTTKVLRWADERGILKTSSPKDQFTKTIEEIGELAAGLCRGDDHKIADSIGDTLVCLICLAALCGMDICDCLESAYNEIAGRKGVMKDGVFVKEDDMEKSEPEKDPSIRLKPNPSKCMICFAHPKIVEECNHCSGTGVEPEEKETEKGPEPVPTCSNCIKSYKLGGCDTYKRTGKICDDHKFI